MTDKNDIAIRSEALGPSNESRASRSESALAGYGDPSSLSENLIDLLADAMHFCDASGLDFHISLAMACRHYVNELNDEQHDERRLS